MQTLRLLPQQSLTSSLNCVNTHVTAVSVCCTVSTLYFHICFCLVCVCVCVCFGALPVLHTLPREAVASVLKDSSVSFSLCVSISPVCYRLVVSLVSFCSVPTLFKQNHSISIVCQNRMNLLFLNGLLDSVMLSRWMAEQRLDLRQRLKALLSVSTGILSVY